MMINFKNKEIHIAFHNHFKMGYLCAGINLPIDTIKTYSLFNFNIDFIFFGFSLGIYRK